MSTCNKDCNIDTICTYSRVTVPVTPVNPYVRLVPLSET